MLELSPALRSELRARAHRLAPVVMIGDKGLTPAVLKEIDVNLRSHELIKIRVATDEREMRAGFLREICDALAAAPVQHIGKILVVYRANPEAGHRTAKRSRSARPPARPSLSAPRPVAAGRAGRPARTGRGRPGSAGRTR